MRAIFFGSSDFAVPSLRATAERTELYAVVTRPDRPAGRGHALRPTAVKAAALEMGLRVVEPPSLRAFALLLQNENIDVFALASYGRILPQALLDVPRCGALNVHPSLLPRHRGATPIQTAIADGRRETGVSIMLMDAGMDTGDIVLQETVAIEPSDDYGALHDRLARIGARMLGDALMLAERGPLPRAQQRGDASVTKPIAKETLLIDWSWDAQRILNHVRAYAPQPLARAEIDGEIVKLLRAHVGADDSIVIDELIAPNHGRETGDAHRRRRAAMRRGPT